VNVNFAPVIDVLTNPKNSMMRGRSFSSDPEVCGKLGSAVCRGIQRPALLRLPSTFPVAAILPKIPSGTSKISKSIDELEKLELIPFRRVIRSRVEGVMVSHLQNTAIDDKYPASLSKATIDGILRKQLRYSKLVISDDLEMKAITDNYGAEEAAVLAVEAGCDCLIYKGIPAFQ